MARRKTGNSIEQYAFLAIRIETYSADISARINHKARDKRYRDDDVCIYDYGSRFEIEGVCTYPNERAGDKYHITVYGRQPGERDLEATLSDYAVRDEEGARKYRKVRGQYIPVYQDPYGLGLLQKERGGKTWHGWLSIPEQIATQMLTLLTTVRPLYMDIHERKFGRTRWINGFGLQTTDPAED